MCFGCVPSLIKRFMCWQLSLQVETSVVETWRGGACCRVTRSLGMLPSKGNSVVLVGAFLRGWIVTERSRSLNLSGFLSYHVTALSLSHAFPPWHHPCCDVVRRPSPEARLVGLPRPVLIAPKAGSQVTQPQRFWYIGVRQTHVKVPQRIYGKNGITRCSFCCKILNSCISHNILFMNFLKASPEISFHNVARE